MQTSGSVTCRIPATNAGAPVEVRVTLVSGDREIHVAQGGANRIRIRHLAEQEEHPGALRLLAFINAPDRMITVVLVGTNLALIMGTIALTRQAEGAPFTGIKPAGGIEPSVMAADAAGSAVVTVEGLGNEDELHPVQEAFVEHGAVQCGFCTPGFLISTTHLLEANPAPTTDEIREALSGNICRCTGYGAVLRAVESLVREDRS